MSIEALEEDPRGAVQGSVLLSDQIEYFAVQHKMIEPFNKDQLKAAAYRLCLGAECQQRGNPITLSETNHYLRIKPYELAVLSTFETVNLPRFIIARWNIRVHMAYEGLVWVGGPQVDPGYQGKLHCPVYNLSNREVILEYKQPIVTIDFVYTTSFNKTKSMNFVLRRAETLRDLDVHKLQSGLAETAKKTLDISEETSKRAADTSHRIDNFQAITFTVLGILVAALSFVGVREFGETSTKLPPPWDTVSWYVVVGVIVLLSIVLAIAGLKTAFRK
jgi:deoxycytidine triphosphate deaminase